MSLTILGIVTINKYTRNLLRDVCKHSGDKKNALSLCILYFYMPNRSCFVMNAIFCAEDPCVLYCE